MTKHKCPDFIIYMRLISGPEQMDQTPSNFDGVKLDGAHFISLQKMKKNREED